MLEEYRFHLGRVFRGYCVCIAETGVMNFVAEVWRLLFWFTDRVPVVDRFVGTGDVLFLDLVLVAANVRTRQVGNDSAILPITRRATRHFVGEGTSDHIAIANNKAKMNVSTLVSGAASVTVTSHPVGFDRGVGTETTRGGVRRIVITCSTLTIMMRPAGPIGRLAHRRLRSVFQNGVAG